MLPADPRINCGLGDASVGSEDSASQDPLPHVFPREMSTYFSDFAVFFGFSEGLQHTSFSEVLSDLVAQHVESHLGANQSSLTAHPLPSAQGLVQSGSDPLPDLSIRRSVQSLQADVSVGVTRGRRCPSIDQLS